LTEIEDVTRVLLDLDAPVLGTFEQVEPRLRIVAADAPDRGALNASRPMIVIVEEFDVADGGNE